MLVLKIAAVAAYFIFVIYNMLGYGIVLNFETLDNKQSFVQGIVVVSLMLYLFTWLYKWAVREKLRGWHVQSVFIVVCGLGIRALMDSLYLLAHPIGMEGSIRTILYYCYVLWAFLLVMLLLVFFVADKRKICICKKRVQKRISIALSTFLICFAVLIVVMIQVNTPEASMLNEYGWLWPLSELSRQIDGYTVLWGLACFFLLWINTKPAKNKLLFQTPGEGLN